jgi:hypothetical protein
VDEAVTVSLVDGAENPPWCALASQAVEVASQAGTSLDKSLRHPGVLESINHENSHTFEMPILSQLRNETLDNLRVLPGLNYLYNINLASTDPQIPVSISVGVCKFWGTYVCYGKFHYVLLSFCNMGA